MMRRLGERLQKQHAPRGQSGPPAAGAGAVSIETLAAKSRGMIKLERN